MANTLDTTALLEVDEAADAVQLGEDQDKRNTLILYINGITDTIERYCGRPFKTRSFTDTFDGDASNIYILKNAPEVTAITDDSVIYNEDGDIVPNDSVKFSSIGVLYLDDGYVFEAGFQNCSVTYTAGFSAVPGSIKIAAIIYLKHLWKMHDKQTERIASKSVGDQSFTFKIEDMPIEAKSILNRYVRPVIA